MPRFFFDFYDGNESSLDDNSTELATAGDAQGAAVRTLTEMANDAFPTSIDRVFVMIVRDEDREALVTATLTLRVEVHA